MKRVIQKKRKGFVLAVAVVYMAVIVIFIALLLTQITYSSSYTKLQNVLTTLDAELNQIGENYLLGVIESSGSYSSYYYTVDSDGLKVYSNSDMATLVLHVEKDDDGQILTWSNK